MQWSNGECSGLPVKQCDPEAIPREVGKRPNEFTAVHASRMFQNGTTVRHFEV